MTRKIVDALKCKAAALMRCVCFLLIPVSVWATDETKLEDGLYAEIKTSRGTILVSLFHEKTPLTVANFVGLAEGTKASNQPAGKRYYDGLTFHRVIPDFMIQGGDPSGNGTGGPGYQFPDEFRADLKHDRAGILSMANAGRGTNGSQFFITHRATPWLDFKHTVFGRVVEGQKVVDAVQQGDRMISVTIIRKGADAQNFKADQAAFDAILARREKEKETLQATDTAAFLKRMKATYPEAREIKSGLLYLPVSPGQGEAVKAGDRVSVHYTGRLESGKQFDSSLDRGRPIRFSVGRGEVIKGWDLGIVGMKKGEKRRLLIPYPLAYGVNGYPGVIPPKAALIFDVELVDFD